MARTVPVGHSHQRRFSMGAPMHALVPGATAGTYVTMCSGGPAHRQYNGAPETVTCARCRRELDKARDERVADALLDLADADAELRGHK